ncbi:2OG-Fe(II) oxygenase [Dactylosporangium sp. NPDC005555]|uniref:2OG-Fe(II) oxygenase family protein n=1 Tax=Dactylosporangium sp. NPDC005555 TaxID=3154889 RepID=UPI0033B27173
MIPSAAVSPLPENVLAQAAAFINPEYLGVEALRAVQTWFHLPDPQPLPLRDFLRPEVADGISGALRTLPSWVRYAASYHGRLDKQEFWGDDADGAATGGPAQYVIRDVAALLDDPALDAGHRQAIERFLVFTVLSEALRGWLLAGTGLELSRHTGVEFACYRDSDGLAPHQDLVPGRVLAANFYLDPAYRTGHGGRLGFRSGSGEHFVEPFYNTLSLMRIREDCWHWVEPYRGDGIGRYTIAVALQSATS